MTEGNEEIETSMENTCHKVDPSNRSANVASRTSGAVEDHGSGASTMTQTRFSFYNADDFKVDPSELLQQVTRVAAAKKSSPPSRLFVPQKQQQLQLQPIAKVDHGDGDGGGYYDYDHGSENESSTTATMLRSLQKSERQRVELRNFQAHHHHHQAHSSQSQPLYNASTRETTTTIASQPPFAANNPYEDAIKEALELLRKHRVALSPKSMPKQQQQQSHIRTTVMTEETHSATIADGTTRPLAVSNSLLTLTPRHADRVLQSRGDDASSMGDGGGSTSSSVPHTGTPARPLPESPDSTFLGEGYQAEIETRRKQRQLRMAKYASRLAELKQDSDNLTPLNNNRFVETLSISSTPGRRTKRSGHNHHLLHRQHASTETEFQNYDDDHDDDNDFFSRHDRYAESEITAGTVSTITAVTTTNRHHVDIAESATTKEEEVQRGVEKVLLAILERAHHRSFSSQSHQSSSAAAGGGSGGGLKGSNHDDSSREGDKPVSWKQGEEKKSSSSEELVTVNGDYNVAADENALSQAVSDLLRTHRSSSSSSSALLNASRSRSPIPPISDLPQQQWQSLKYSDSAASIEVDDYDPISASRSMSDAGGCRPPYSATTSQDDDVQLSSSNLLSPKHHRGVSSPLPATSIRTFETSNYTTELANTSDGQIEAVASDPGMMTELDELVRKVSDRSHDVYHPTLSSQLNENNPLGSVTDESIDEKVRRLLSNRDDDPDSGLPAPEDDSEEDESLENTSVMDRTSSSSASSFDESLLDDDNDDESYDDESDARNQSGIDLVLGPLSRKGTGVVLEPDSPKKQEPAPSILESLSAAVSLVVSGNSAVGSAGGGGLFRDTSVSEEVESESDRSDSEVSESNGLMRSLCAHLLPVGVSQTSKVLDELPEWDETNPDEPGYRIVRLTKQQLRRVEEEFKLMADNLKRSSELNLRKLAGSDETFERDLQAAEELLDREEERIKETEDSVADPGGSVSVSRRPKIPTSPDRQSLASTDDENASVGLPNFPGVKRAGEGEMGDFEFFCLPIIFKSHVTGFEPTKDLCLEAGNVIAGQYLVVGELGSAAFSTAYRCIDLNSQGSGPDGHEEVCLKVIKNTKDFFDQSLDEIKILELLRQTGQCQEKCIVEMRTFFYHREHLIIVTELLRQNLFEFGKFIVDNDEEPYFTLPRVAFITRQVLIALDFVHKLGLVHSDVKPENILLVSYSRAKVKLIDFGSSCYLTDRQSSYIQSRSYRAPEVVLGLPYDGRIDIWSLGCVVAEMFTGEVTFQNDSIVSMLSRIEAICGPFPRHMIAQGRQSGRFFTKCGLLFERAQREAEIEDDDAGSATSSEKPKTEPHYDIFQPKLTTLAARLGFDSNLLDIYCNDSIADPTTKQLLQPDGEGELRCRAMFVHFVRQLLTIDPETRLTAAQALQHPWMQFAASLTEEDIMYPSSND